MISVNWAHAYMADVQLDGLQIRTQIAKEMTKDLQEISQENASLMRESLSISFNLANIVAHPTDKA